MSGLSGNTIAESQHKTYVTLQEIVVSSLHPNYFLLAITTACFSCWIKEGFILTDVVQK